MEKTYSPSIVEDTWYSAWMSRGLFSADEKSKKPAYSIVIPPPNVTGILHMGHALNNTIQDILIRWKRMSGFETLWVPGTDHAGIATQAVVEKRLFEVEKKTRHDLGRAALVKRIWEWKDENETRITGQLKKLGCACDWSRQRFTLDATCARAVRHTFFSLFKKGLIYRGKRLVNWDTHLQTAVADDEIFYETVKSSMLYFRYPLADGSGYLPVATTRPETILGDTAVAVHPEDTRYQAYIGKMAKVPFIGREIPVIADAVLVDPAFGTGCVKVTPAHDPADYQTGLRHNLPMVNILTENGLINENGGPFSGQKRYACREKIVEGLKQMGLFDKTEPYEMQIGHSDRSKTPIEPYLSSQWFVSMGDFAEKAMQAVRDRRVQFYPERYAKGYLDWLGEKRDWCISRQLWWGHQIPIWYCETCTEDDLRRAFGSRTDIAWSFAENRWLICALEEELREDALGPAHRLARDPDVLDTWFSSALWPHSTMGWPESTGLLKKFYPTSVLVTNRDIISLWVARMVIFGQENTNTEPFHHVYIHAAIMDGNGQRMSKSKGNGVDPLDIIEKYGADALRYTMASLCTDNQDARLPVRTEKLPDGRTINVSEKFDIGRNFANKLWNASRFVLGAVESPLSFDALPPAARLRPEDRWILSRLNHTIASLTEEFEQYRFSEACHQIYEFAWKEFCDWYIEMKKADLYQSTDAQRRLDALNVLGYVLGSLLKALHPIMPFITQEIWSSLRATINHGAAIDHEFILCASFPKSDAARFDDKQEKEFGLLQEVIVALRTIRSENNVPPDKKGEALIVPAGPEELELFSRYRDMINLFVRLSATTVDPKAAKPAFAGQSVVRGNQLFLKLEGLIDRSVEKTRLTKEIARLTSLIAATEKRLAAPSFAEKAPLEIVAREREKCEGMKADLEKFEKSLSSL